MSCQTYIFKRYSSPAIQWRTTFNLKCIFVHSHAHPLSKNWLSQHIPKKQIPKLTQMTSIWELPNIYIQKYTGEQPSTSNAYFSTPMHTLWAKIGWASIFLKSRFQIDANDLNLRVAQMYIFKIYSSSTYTPENNLQPKMHICPLPCTPFEQKLAEPAYS